jgi:hypothetical protein
LGLAGVLLLVAAAVVEPLFASAAAVLAERRSAAAAAVVPLPALGVELSLLAALNSELGLVADEVAVAVEAVEAALGVVVDDTLAHFVDGAVVLNILYEVGLPAPTVDVVYSYQLAVPVAPVVVVVEAVPVSEPAVVGLAARYSVDCLLVIFLGVVPTGPNFWNSPLVL